MAKFVETLSCSIERVPDATRQFLQMRWGETYCVHVYSLLVSAQKLLYREYLQAALATCPSSHHLEVAPRGSMLSHSARSWRFRPEQMNDASRATCRGRDQPHVCVHHHI